MKANLALNTQIDYFECNICKTKFNIINIYNNYAKINDDTNINIYCHFCGTRIIINYSQLEQLAIEFVKKYYNSEIIIINSIEISPIIYCIQYLLSDIKLFKHHEELIRRDFGDTILLNCYDCYNNNFNNVIAKNYYLIYLINSINNNTISKLEAMNIIDNMCKLYNFNIENNQYYIKLINI